MRKLLFIFLTLIHVKAFSQILIQGKIRDIDGIGLPGAIINEIGTDNKITTNVEGNFLYKTIQDSCTISFYFIGLEPKTLVFTRDTTIDVTLEFRDYNSRWLTIGTNYDFYHTVYGFQISNGFDEEKLIHFEDFQDNFLIKILGQTDFKTNYSYGAEVGWAYLPIRYLARLSLGYSVRNFESTKLFLKDLNLSSGIGYFGNSLILIQFGNQKLQGNNNVGLALGMEQKFKSLYFGFLSGYYFDYFNHTAYFQIGHYNKGLFSFRTTYNRINNFNLLTLGVNYTFLRNKNH
jgi:hypothetical protein